MQTWCIIKHVDYTCRDRLGMIIYNVLGAEDLKVMYFTSFVIHPLNKAI